MIRYLKKASSSLVGNILLSEVLFSIPLSVLGLILNSNQGTLSLVWGVWIISICAVGGVAMGVLLWFTIAKPLLDRQRGGKPRGRD